MANLTSNKDLLEIVTGNYGGSLEWLLGLADELQVPYNTARHLAVEAGYYRHCRIDKVSLQDFTAKPYAQLVIKKKGLIIV